MLRLSGSGTLQILIGTASYIGLVRILSTFGSAALAGYTIGIRIIIFALLPAFGISNAAATMVGQNLGAGRPDRAERAVWTAALYNMIFLGGDRRCLLLRGAAQIAGLFTADPAVQPLRDRLPADRQPRASCSMPCGMVLTQSFNGAGDTWTPTLINLGVFWLFEIPLAWLLAHQHAGFGPTASSRHDDRLLGARRRQRGGLSDGEVEGEERLGAHAVGCARLVRTLGAHGGCSHRGSGGHPLFNIDLTTRARRFGSIPAAAHQP